jgi:pilus assembly protein CpaB
VDLVAGEQLVSSRFVVPTQLGAITVPDGLQEVTVAVPPERAVGGALQPGDTAAVTASFTEDASDGAKVQRSHMILHKVLVTRVQVAAQQQVGPQPSSGEAAAPQGNILVTLALPAASVERVVFTAEHGTLWLSREPEDTPEGRTTILTPENIYQ